MVFAGSRTLGHSLCGTKIDLRKCRHHDDMAVSSRMASAKATENGFPLLSNNCGILVFDGFQDVKGCQRKGTAKAAEIGQGLSLPKKYLAPRTC